jgi:hypothetical protein
MAKGLEFPKGYRGAWVGRGRLSKRCCATSSHPKTLQGNLTRKKLQRPSSRINFFPALLVCGASMLRSRRVVGASAIAFAFLAMSVMRCSSSTLAGGRMRSDSGLFLQRSSSSVLRTLSLRGGSSAPRMGDNGAVPLVKPMGGLRRTNSYSALNEILLTGEKSGHTGQADQQEEPIPR